MDKPYGSIPTATICFFTTFWMALVVKRPPLREIKRASVLPVTEFRTESHLDIDCLTAGVIKILRSLLPFPIIECDIEEICDLAPEYLKKLKGLRNQLGNQKATVENY
jgi:hypothetical protein